MQKEDTDLNTIPWVGKPSRRRSGLLSIATCLLAVPLATYAQTPQEQAQVKPLPVPTGVVPLPQQAPPTTPLGPVPKPALPLPKPSQPLMNSPGLDALQSYLQGKPVTIDQAVAIALGTNRELAQAVAALLTAEGRTEEARTAFNPTVGVNAQITEFNRGNKATFGGVTLPLLYTFNPIVVAQASLPLDVFGTLKAAKTQAQFQEVAARLEVNRIRNQIVFQVRNAFYQLLQARAQLAVAADTLQTTLLRLDTAQKSYAAGVSPRFDVIQSQTDVAAAQDAYLRAQQQLSLSLTNLKNVMGLSISAPLEITDAGAITTPPGVPLYTAAPQNASSTAPSGEANADSGQGVLSPTQQMQKIVPGAATLAEEGIGGGKPLTVADPLNLGPEYQKLVQEALHQRPEILEAEAQMDAAKAGLTLANASELPTFGLGFSYTLNPNAAGFTLFNQAAVTLNVNIPIWDGGLARARREQAHGQLAQAEVAYRNAVDLVSADVRQAYINLIQAQDRVAVANVTLAQAQEAYRLAQVRYKAGVSQQQGVSPILELNTTQTSLTQAESDQVAALYAYNIARAQLDAALGRAAFVGQAPGYASVPSTKEVPPSK